MGKKKFQSSQSINHINDNVTQQTPSCSTPIDDRKLHNSYIQLSTILNNTDVNQSTKKSFVPKENEIKNSTVQSNTSESTVPSGATDILNAIGDDWMTFSTEIHDDSNNLNLSNNNHNNYDDQGNSNKCDNNELDLDYSSKDPDYSLNQNSTNNNSDNTDRTLQSHSKDKTSRDNSSRNNSSRNNSSRENFFQDVSPLDIRNVQIPCSKDSSLKRTVKKYFCPYCKKFQTKFARHLEMKHKMEADVQKFIHIKKGTHERAKLIATIRNHGSLLHNTHNELNTGILVTVRQRQAKYNKTADDYTCCSNCKGFYSKCTIRLHYKKCKTTYKKGVHEIMVMGRRITGYIHSCANKVLREIVFPVLKDDAVTRCIKYDELLILFGNKLCERYTSTHQHDMIRAHLRLLGRYKLAIQEIDKKIDDF